MIDIQSLLPYYPQAIATQASFHRHILKEYIELLALEHIAQTPHAAKVVFIGGTNLRIIHGIDRFSEDLDFDCKNMSEEEFVKMTDMVVEVLLSMKIAALLARGKGRDFYDTMFLWQQAEPDYRFLSERCGIKTPADLKSMLDDKLATVNLKQKQRDFEHLLFNPSRSKQILLFKEFVDGKL